MIFFYYFCYISMDHELIEKIRNESTKEIQERKTLSIFWSMPNEHPPSGEGLEFCLHRYEQ